MISIHSSAPTLTVRPFTFESYGVTVRIDGNSKDLVDEGKHVATRSLLNFIRPVRRKKADQHFLLERKGLTYFLIQNGEAIASGRSRKKFFKFFDSVIRAAVAELAVDWVFLHAGVVGWKGTAIVMPADSFKGKTTLTAELVRRGAEYFSDDFAVFDRDGLVHAYPRPFAMRTSDGNFREYQLTVESLGGTYGREALPVGLVLFTEYQTGAKWNPAVMTPGEGALEMIPYALTFRHRPEFSLQVLKYIVSRAIIASSPRGSAEDFAEVILNFVDKSVN